MKYLSDIFLIGVSFAVVCMFIIVKVDGFFTVTEGNDLILWLEVGFFTAMIIWGIYSLCHKLGERNKR